MRSNFAMSDQHDLQNKFLTFGGHCGGQQGSHGTGQHIGSQGFGTGQHIGSQGSGQNTGRQGTEHGSHIFLKRVTIKSNLLKIFESFFLKNCTLSVFFLLIFTEDF
jgi:hypothetical protein